MLLAAVARWRGHPITSLIFTVAGTPLVVAAFAVPTWLGPIEAGWMLMARMISRVTTPIVMAVIYYVVVSPVGLLRRAFGGNPLSHAETSRGFWKGRTTRSSNMERQF